MAIIEPTRHDIQHPSKIKRYSFSLRLWHWLNLIVISGSLTTVFINSTITDDHATSALIKDEIQKTGTTLTNEQTQIAAHALSNSVWGIHIYFGYVLAGLLVFRLILEFFQLADQKFISKLKSAYYQFNAIKKTGKLSGMNLPLKLFTPYFMHYLP